MPAASGTTAVTRRVREPRTHQLPARLSDDAIADRLESAPSRRLMDRPRPRVDFIEGLSTFYDAVRHLAQHRGVRFLTSWEELSGLCGYGDRDNGLRSCVRYSQALQEVGVIRLGGVRVGRTWGVAVELGELSSTGPRPCSSTGFATRLAPFSRRRHRRLSCGHKCLCDGGRR